MVSAIVGVALLGACVNVPLPFAGDQSLFALGAGEMSRGAVLYLDFWDIKQLRISWFFEAARALYERRGNVGLRLPCFSNTSCDSALASAPRRMP